ncbi:hypothetical protein FACS1894200_02710 [Spirochaetia bacterium]|nr:hypothetical protein FACS1894200_02710 [Spirochaetia bacterium]
MARMTEEEADALDELWTKTTPPLKHGAGGFFTRQQDMLAALDSVTATYIRSQSEALHQPPRRLLPLWFVKNCPLPFEPV